MIDLSKQKEQFIRDNTSTITDSVKAKVNDAILSSDIDKTKLVNDLVKAEVDQRFLNETIKTAHEISGFKSYVYNDFGVAYQIYIPDFSKAMVLDDVIIKQYSLVDGKRELCMNLSTEVLNVFLMKYNTKGVNLKIENDDEKFMYNVLIEQNVLEGIVVGNEVHSVKVKHFGNLAYIQPTKTIVNIVSYVIDDYGYTLYTLMYSIKDRRFLTVSSIKIVKELADFIKDLYIDSLKKAKEYKENLSPIQIQEKKVLYLTKQINLMQKQLEQEQNILENLKQRKGE